MPKSSAPPDRRRILGSAAGGSVAVGGYVAACVGSGSEGSSVPTGAVVAVACGAQAEMSKTKIVIKLIARYLLDMVVSPQSD